MAAENPYPECGRGIGIGQSLGRSSLAETFDAPDNQGAGRVVKRVLVFDDESAQTVKRGVPDHEEAGAIAVGEMGRVRTRSREGAA